jgi:MoaA/NifB/PqqE/SkfB family radical SAM enzyme
MNNLLNAVDTCVLFTGTFGRRGCTANCLGCFVGEYEENNPMYQGTIKQIYELLPLLPNVKRVNIVGNPDPSVDTKFCNAVAKVIQEHGKQISFCTNGVGCDKVVKMLVEGLDPSLIHAFVFSVDSLDEEKNSFMRGTKISLQSIFESMKYLKGLDIGVQAFFTVWPANMDEDWEAYRVFFESRGIYVNGRFGNVESAKGRIDHVPEMKILEIRNKYPNVRLSVLLANDEEYMGYMDTFVAKDEFRCTDLTKIKVYLTDEGIKASYWCPIVSTVYPEYFDDIRNLRLPDFYEKLIKTGICPIAKQAFGFENKGLHSICRFHKTLPKKLLPKNPFVSF